MGFTILGPGGFASNAFAWAEPVRARRTVFAPFADVALPVIDPADIAEVAAAALREDGHAGRTYELTGPEAISPRGQAAVISEALGEEVALVELSREEAHTRMARFMPEEVIDGTLDVLGVPLPAEQKASPDVERILRRPARSFGAWVARNLSAFRWSPPWGARKTPLPPGRTAGPKPDHAHRPRPESARSAGRGHLGTTAPLISPPLAGAEPQPRSAAPARPALEAGQRAPLTESPGLPSRPR
ncbi:Rossmann-fold NAD(P)-binding domain-containing protein [Streptomyces koyangensis]|uniref:hypothetical protein n=1 Tax=Streptomyces koyangensis TaxID=188770 RepID=UPI00384F7EA9